MFSVLVLLEDSKNVWSDHLPKKIGNPPAKNRFFHFRHAVPRDCSRQGYRQIGGGEILEKIEDWEMDEVDHLRW